jgi:DNA-binding transcriptional ArsR family regulator
LRNQIIAHIFATMKLQVKHKEIRRDVFQAIADPTRRAILVLIAFQALTPNAIAEHFDSSRQAVSKHIQILSECRLLIQEKNGREIYYHLNPKKIKELADFIEPFRKLWDERFNQLEIVMKNYKSKK